MLNTIHTRAIFREVSESERKYCVFSSNTGFNKKTEPDTRLAGWLV